MINLIDKILQKIPSIKRIKTLIKIAQFFMITHFQWWQF